MKKLSLFLARAALAAAALGSSAGASTLTTLWAFDGTDGSAPTGGVIFDAAGNLYGAAAGTCLAKDCYDGAVFELSPPGHGQTQWTETLLHSLIPLAFPSGPVVFDGAGNMFGVAPGNGCLVGAGVAPCIQGKVFELSPPVGGTGAWTKIRVHVFEPGVEVNPNLIRDGAGNLYGSAAVDSATSAGQIFELTPPAVTGGTWTKSVLHRFAPGVAPANGLLFGPGGVLYGMTSTGGAGGAGTVYQLSPPAAGHHRWTKQVLYSFAGGADAANPTDMLISDAMGNLFAVAAGGSSGQGCVFELSPPASAGGAWTEAVIYSFAGGNDGAGPTSALLLDAQGNLYGTTSHGGPADDGTIFELSRPILAGGVWSETVLYSFTGGSDGDAPSGALVADTAGNFYGTATYSAPTGPIGPFGTVFELTP